MTTDKPTSFRNWAVAARPRLRRTAYLLCGDWHLAEDLTQETLVRNYGRWRRIESDNPDGYARTTLVNAYRSAIRRPWRREAATDLDSELASVVDKTGPSLEEAGFSLEPVRDLVASSGLAE